MKEIVLRKDFQRIRTLVKNRVRKGKIKAELEESRRINRVLATLSEFDFLAWDGSQTKMTLELITAVVKEYGGSEGIPEGEVVFHFRRVLTSGTLKLMAKRGEVDVHMDSYGRRSYGIRRR